jgi:hypothetical protein
MTLFQLFIDFEKGYDSIRREVLHSILNEFVTPMKLVTLIKMFKQNYSKVCIGKNSI